MELPKNITQIGESDSSCKIYVEDYVVSYIKQLNHLAQNKEMAVALYGVRKEEAGVSYLFLYGAAKLDFLQRETRHLSQAQQQEIERLRKRYFAEYEFLGYRLLNGEMVEGFHVCEQGICRYITGYAQFYEKNDSMLAYMLEIRKEEIQPEVVNQEKYEAVQRRREERKAAETSAVKEYSGNTSSAKHASSTRSVSERENHFRENRARQRGRVTEPIAVPGVGRLKVSIVAAFVLLCVLGLALIGTDGSMENIQVAARQLMEQVTEQKLPDTMEVVNQNVQSDTLATEDKLTNALEKENQTANVPIQQVSSETPQPGISEQSVLPENPAVTPAPETTSEPTPVPTPTPTPVPTPTPTPVVEQTPAPTQPPAASAEPEPQPVSYTIQQGDTLIGISIRNYGSEAKVKDICTLNEIINPDDIKVGQKILLP